MVEQQLEVEEEALGLLSPASSVIEGIANFGFLGFFVFMLSMGVAILRRHGTRQSVDVL